MNTSTLTRSSRLTGSTAPAVTFSPPVAEEFTLNISPLAFSRDRFRLGQLPFESDEAYEKLRADHRDTHVFRLDTRSGRIGNVTLDEGDVPLGKIEEAATHEHLLLLGKAVNACLLRWLVKNQRQILKPAKPIVFLGKRAHSRLLATVLEEFRLDSDPRLEVLTRYALNTRLIYPGDNGIEPALGLVIELKTANIIDIPVSELADRGMRLVGKYVCRRSEEEDGVAEPRLEAIGAVTRITRGRVYLSDAVGPDVVNADEVLLEPRSENLGDVIQALYPERAYPIIRRLRQRRAGIVQAETKLAQTRELLASIQQRCPLGFADGLQITCGALVVPGAEFFPTRITTEAPALLFGPQGRNVEVAAEKGLSTFGPYLYPQHARNEPLIAVVCEAGLRGRVEQFVESLRTGFPEEEWNRQGHRRANPFAGGLLGRFRLDRVSVEIEEVSGPNPQHYRRAVEKLLHRLPQTPDAALVQTRMSSRQLRGDASPYLVSKADFMTAGVPVQGITLEKIEEAASSNPYVLSDVALALYAKLEGVPWLISTRRPSSHELVVGLGYTETSSSRLGNRSRYVGITTVFQGDGRYRVWGHTREAEFEEYADALLETLTATIRQVERENIWQPDDEVRLVFHVFKPLKNKETDAIQRLVSALVANRYRVSYAFLDLSRHHPHQIFAPQAAGFSYRGGAAVRGKGVPERGLALRLGPRATLLQLTGSRELKTSEQGIPLPLLIELHRDSSFDDLTYLTRQIYHFSFVCWQRFLPVGEPVTMRYSYLIARALANLKPVSGWDSRVLTQGSLRGKNWFL